MFSPRYFRTQSDLYILYGFSKCKFTCVYHPTGAAGEVSPTQALLNKKELKQHMESLNIQLEQVTKGTKEQQDCLLSITKGSPDNKYSLFPMPWWPSWFHNFTLGLFHLRSDLLGIYTFRMFLCQTLYLQMLPRSRTWILGRSVMGRGWVNSSL